MKKIITLSVILLSFISLSIPTQTFTCSCTMPESPQKELEKADYVFIGTVNNIDEVTFIEEFLPGEKFERTNKEVKFSNTTNIKGLKSNGLTLSTPQHGGTCGINFEENKEYIVYAHQGTNNEISAWSCSRTNQIKYAQDDIIAFKDTIEKNKNSQLPIDHSQTNYLAIIGSLITLLVLLIFGIYKLSKQKDTD